MKGVNRGSGLVSSRKDSLEERLAAATTSTGTEAVRPPVRYGFPNYTGIAGLVLKNTRQGLDARVAALSNEFDHALLYRIGELAENAVWGGKKWPSM